MGADREQHPFGAGVVAGMARRPVVPGLVAIAVQALVVRLIGQLARIGHGDSGPSSL